MLAGNWPGPSNENNVCFYLFLFFFIAGIFGSSSSSSSSLLSSSKNKLKCDSSLDSSPLPTLFFSSHFKKRNITAAEKWFRHRRLKTELLPEVSPSNQETKIKLKTEIGPQWLLFLRWTEEFNFETAPVEIRKKWNRDRRRRQQQVEQLSTSVVIVF